MKNKNSTVKKAFAIALLSVSLTIKVMASENVLIGDENSVLTVEEFADFSCKHCTRGANTMDQLVKSYNGKVKLVFKNFPLDTEPEGQSMLAARAFTSIYLQSSDLAHTFERELFAHQKTFLKQGETYIYELADSIGVNLVRLKQDIKSQQVKSSVEDDIERGRKLKVTGVPSFLIGDQLVQGAYSYEAFKKIIDQKLNP